MLFNIIGTSTSKTKPGVEHTLEDIKPFAGILSFNGNSLSSGEITGSICDEDGEAVVEGGEAIRRNEYEIEFIKNYGGTHVYCKLSNNTDSYYGWHGFYLFVSVTETLERIRKKKITRYDGMILCSFLPQEL
jgi:hypothetical protein